MVATQERLGGKVQGAAADATAHGLTTARPPTRNGPASQALKRDRRGRVALQPSRLPTRLLSVAGVRPCRVTAHSSRGDEEQTKQTMQIKQPRIPMKPRRQQRQSLLKAVEQKPMSATRVPSSVSPSRSPPARPSASARSPPSSSSGQPRTSGKSNGTSTAKDLFRSPAIVGIGLCLVGQAAAEAVSASVNFLTTDAKKKRPLAVPKTDSHEHHQQTHHQELLGGIPAPAGKQSTALPADGTEGATLAVAGLLPTVMWWETLESALQRNIPSTSNGRVFDGREYCPAEMQDGASAPGLSGPQDPTGGPVPSRAQLPFEGLASTDTRISGGAADKPLFSDLRHLAEELEQLNAALDSTNDLLRNLVDSSPAVRDDDSGWVTAHLTSQVAWFPSMDELKGSLPAEEEEELPPGGLDESVTEPVSGQDLLPRSSADSDIAPPCSNDMDRVLVDYAGDASVFDSMDELMSSLCEELLDEQELIPASISDAWGHQDGPDEGDISGTWSRGGGRGLRPGGPAAACGSMYVGSLVGGSTKPMAAAGIGTSLASPKLGRATCGLVRAAACLDCPAATPDLPQCCGGRGETDTPAGGRAAGFCEPDVGSSPLPWLTVGMGSVVATAAVALLRFSEVSRCFSAYMSNHQWLVHSSLQDFWQLSDGVPASAGSKPDPNVTAPSLMATACAGAMAMAHSATRGIGRSAACRLPWGPAAVAAAMAAVISPWSSASLPGTCSAGCWPQMVVTIEVKEDTSFWVLSHKYYGTGVMWKQLRGANPHVPTKAVKAGTRLRLYLQTEAGSMEGFDPAITDHAHVSDSELLSVPTFIDAAEPRPLISK